MIFSFLMPYFDRAEQLGRTLESFRFLYGPTVQYEVVLVEDKKNWSNARLTDALTNVLDEFPDIIVNRIPSHHEGYNPAPHYNQAARLAKGDYLVITNPECRHKQNILGGLANEFSSDPDCYVVCGCISIRGGEFHRWFQHSEHHNRLFHFCSAMSAKTYQKVGGFDAAFGDGFGFDDDDFRDTILESGIRIVTRDDLIVFHQEHTKNSVPGYGNLHGRNKKLWLSKHPNRARWLKPNWKRETFNV